MRRLAGVSRQAKHCIKTARKRRGPGLCEKCGPLGKPLWDAEI